MIRSLPITLFFIGICTFSAYAQIISGHVQDATSAALPFASVVASACADEQVLAFATSDEKGAYQLTVTTTCDTILVTARCLGYTTLVKKVPASAFTRLDFELNASVLQEVLIRAKTPPIIVRKDTTEFNAASFSDSTEFSVETLLKKLPGVQIDATGRISYHGKAVDRVLVEGDDLFSQNYQIATRNIRADMISKVQVIDRYEENPVLKEFSATDRTVMNLKIKPDRKRGLTGSITVGLGYGAAGKGRGHFNLFSLSRKDKLYLIGDANNTGENTSSVDQLSRGDPFDPNQQMLQGNILEKRSLVSTPQYETAGLPQAFTSINRSGLIFVGEILPISDHFKIKISSWLARERLWQTSDATTNIQLEPDNLTISEQKQHNSTQGVRNFQSEITYYSPNKKHALRSFIKINGNPNHYNIQTLRNQTGSGPNTVSNQGKTRQGDVLLSLEYTYQYRPDALFQVVGKSAGQQYQNQLNPKYTAYAAFFGIDSNYTQLQQQANLQQYKQLLLGRFLLKRNGFQGQLELGGENYLGKMQSDLQLKTENGSNFTPNDSFYRNKLRFYVPRVYALAGLSRKIGFWDFQAQIKPRFQPLSIRTPDQTTHGGHDWALEPEVNMHFKPDERNSVSANYKFRQNAPEITSLYSSYFFSDYQTLQKGLNSLGLITGQSAGLYYRFIDRPKQLSWHASLGYQNTLQQFGGQYKINPYLSVQELYRPVQSRVLNAAIGGSRFVPKISCRLELEAVLARFQQVARLNEGSSGVFNTTLPLVKLGFGTAFNTWVNVILNTQYSLYLTQHENNHAQLSSWTSTLQIKVRPSKSFNAQFNIYHTANQADPTLPYRSFLTSEMTAAYSLPKWHSNIMFQAFNLLNNRRFEQVSATGFYTFRTGIQAVKPFFVLAWDYGF
jgi:hypothetical protein